jgi:hypothetical protein
MVPILFIFSFQIFEMWQTTTLKRNLVPEIRRVRKKDGFGILGGLPPLKGTFVGSLGFGFMVGTSWIRLGTGSSFVLHSIKSSSIWCEYSILHCRASVHHGSCLNYFGHGRVTLWVNQKTKLECSHSLISYPLFGLHRLASHLQR